MAAEVAADDCCICDLECEGGEPDEDVDGGHRGLDEGVEDGAVEVVDCL